MLFIKYTIAKIPLNTFEYEIAINITTGHTHTLLKIMAQSNFDSRLPFGTKITLRKYYHSSFWCKRIITSLPGLSNVLI